MAVGLKAAASREIPERDVLTNLRFIIPIWLSCVRKYSHKLRTGNNIVLRDEVL